MTTGCHRARARSVMPYGVGPGESPGSGAASSGAAPSPYESATVGWGGGFVDAAVPGVGLFGALWRAFAPRRKLAMTTAMPATSAMPWIGRLMAGVRAGEGSAVGSAA